MNKLIGITLVIAASACGHAPTGAASKQPVPALQQQYPALAWVPAEATYVATGKVSEISTTLREVLVPVRMLQIPGVGSLQSLFGRVFGLDPFDSAQLARAGVAIDSTAALYSTGLWPTLAVPIEDVSALRAYLDKRWPTTAVRMREHDGAEVYTWQPVPNFALSYALVDDWLLVHIADPAGEATPVGWLDEARATFAGARAGIAGADELEAAARSARDRLAAEGARALGVLGLVRVPRIVQSIGAADACLTSIGGAVDRVVVGSELSARSGEGLIAFELNPVVAAAARLGAPSPPSRSYLAYRATAGLYGDLGVDLRWLDAALTRAGCPGLGDGLGDVTRLLDAYDARTVHVAVHRLSLDERDVEAAAHVGLRSRAAIDRQLDGIPGRSLLERTVTIGGTRVRVIDLGIVPRIGYVLSDAQGVVAVGSESIERVFAPPPEGAAPDGLLFAAMGVRPEQMPDMEAALAVIFEQMGYSPTMASTFYKEVLSRYAEAGFSLSLSGAAIELRGRYELAP